MPSPARIHVLFRYHFLDRVLQNEHDLARAVKNKRGTITANKCGLLSDKLEYARQAPLIK